MSTSSRNNRDPHERPHSGTVPVPEDDRSEHPLVGTTPRSFPDQPVAETSHGLVMPKIGFGTWQVDSPTAALMVGAAIDMGYRHIDTAQMYENEGGVGAGIEASGISRDELFVTTKIANDRHSPSDLVASVETSLEMLGTDHVDLLLLHWPGEWEQVTAALATMASVQASGMAHHIGVSNFTLEQLEVAHTHAPLEVLQVECHPFFQQNELRQWCVDHDWILTAYSPIAQGAVADDDTLAEIAEHHGTSAVAVALAWLMGEPNVVTIPRTTNPRHLAANWEARHLRLDDDERDRIRGLDRDQRIVDPSFAPWR